MVQPFVRPYEATRHTQPDDYAITAYNAGLVIANAVGDPVKAGKPVTRANVRDAIQASKTSTLQGEVAFDQSGDIVKRTVSVFQVENNTGYPLTAIIHQCKYMGTSSTS